MEISSQMVYSLSIMLFSINYLNKTSRLPYIFACVSTGHAPSLTSKG